MMQSDYYFTILFFSIQVATKNRIVGYYLHITLHSTSLCTKAAVYTAERFVLQKPFLSLKIRGLNLSAVSNQERVVMVRVRYNYSRS